MSLKVSTQIGQGQGFQRQGQEAMVDVQDEKSVAKWAQVLQVEPPELLKLVQEFGPKIKDIRLGLAAREKAA